MKFDALFDTFPELFSSNLVLKKIEERHLKEVYDIYSNERVFEYCGILPKSNMETIKSMIGHFERDFNKRTRIKWGIFLNDNLVGIIEAFDFNKKVDMVTVGYFLAEAYWGKGIASKALKMLVEFLFDRVEVNGIQAEVMPSNEISKRVLLKNGFIKEGTFRQAAIWTGKGRVDLEIYGLLREDISQSNV